MHGVVDEKTDVYAHGVLLLELITGRKALDSSQQSLVMWVCLFFLLSASIPCIICTVEYILFTIQIVLNNTLQAKPLLSKNSIKELVDPCLADAYDSEQMNRLALTASLCIHQSSVHRPKMSQACLLSENTKNISSS